MLILNFSPAPPLSAAQVEQIRASVVRHLDARFAVTPPAGACRGRTAEAQRRLDVGRLRSDGRSIGCPPTRHWLAG